MKIIANALTVALATATVTSAAQGQQAATPAPPHVVRPITPGGMGANLLPVDLPLLIEASPLAFIERGGRAGLGELRLHQGAQGTEVPYLFVWPAEAAETWQDGRIIPVTPGRDTSGFELDLGRPVTVDAIDVTDLPEGTLKGVHLEGSGDRVRWTSLTMGSLFNVPATTGAAALRNTTLPFTAGSYRYLRLISDDRAGMRLPAGIRARARVARREGVATDSIRVPLVVEPRPSARRTSRYHLTLPASRLPVVALEISIGGEQVLRHVQVTEPRLGTRQVEPQPRFDGFLRRASAADTMGGGLRLSIQAPTGAELDLVVDDDDNRPLDIRGVRAVLTPLPSIFFVVTSTDSIWATYGTDRRASIEPPRYDLAAIEDSIRRVPAVAAHWGDPRGASATTVASETPRALYADPGSPLSPSAFRFSRALPAGAGLSAVRLDAAVLAHSRIEDVRILDSQGRQVPYLLERLDEPTEVRLAAPASAAARPNIDARAMPDAATRSWYRVHLPLTGLPGAILRLETSARVFTRSVGVVTRDLPRDAHPDADPNRTIVADWSHDDPDAPAPALEVPLGARLPGDSLFLLVNDGDNQRLPLSAATLLLPSFRLRFFREPGAELTLVYGRDDLGAPRYDLALIAPRLLDAPAAEILASAEKGGLPSHGRTPQLVFWAVLATAVVVLLVMLARLLKTPEAEAGPVS